MERNKWRFYQCPKRLFQVAEESASENEDSNYSEGEKDDSNKEDLMENGEEELDAKGMFTKTWESRNPTNTKENVIGKWYGVVYQSKRGSMLFVDKILRHFSKD